MKKIKDGTRWILSAIILLFIFVNGANAGSAFLLLAGFFMMPLSFMKKFYNRYKIKTLFPVILSILLFITAVMTSPPEINQGAEGNVSVSSEITPVSVNSEAPSQEISSSEKTQSTENSVISESFAEDNSQGQDSAVSQGGIPAFSGNPYVILNNNVPVFADSEKKNTGYEKYQSLDSLGRTLAATACVGRDTMPKENEERGSISSIKPSGWVQAKYDTVSGKYLYNRCHLIGWQLSAENANRGNLITGTKYLNIEGMLPFENMVADYIKETGNHVAYRITPIYEGSNLLASGVQMEALSVEDGGEGICFNVYCYNVQPGIDIDYKTGKSSLSDK